MTTLLLIAAWAVAGALALTLTVFALFALLVLLLWVRTRLLLRHVNKPATTSSDENEDTSAEDVPVFPTTDEDATPAPDVETTQPIQPVGVQP